MKKSKLLGLWKKHWFLVGIMGTILLAEIFPQMGAKEGPLIPEITVKYGAVSLIFLISGLSIKLEELLGTVKNMKIHVFIQVFSHILMPISVKIFTIFLHFFGVNEWILKGLLTVACMPPPVSSAVILTRAVGGNEAAAIFNSVLGIVMILVFSTWLVFNVASKMKRSFRPEDVIAILFCCTHKSLTLGIPILRIIYGGYSHLSTISLPLLVYHPTQIILGGLTVAYLKEWVVSRHRSRFWTSSLHLMSKDFGMIYGMRVVLYVHFTNYKKDSFWKTS
ncbi:Sodium/bile acid cotransporter 7-B [Blattella germanica]|nr:Sodium/bile acid cotransporter 7-B [Blattella germanica]